MKRIVILSVALAISQFSFGQNDLDAYRYSTNIYTGSARFAGMAGSFGALGGDFSVASTNPAGLGIYRSSDFSFTPSLNFNKTASSYLGANSDENRFAIGISSIGLVSTFKNPSQSGENGVVSFNFGVGYNKLRDFNANQITTGNNDHWSIIDQFAHNANNDQNLSASNPGDLTFIDGGPSPFNNNSWETVMAWNNFMIDTAGNQFIPLITGTVMQNRSVVSRGSLGEYVLSFAGNVAEKFFFGGTLGIQDLYYKYTSTYTEDGEVGNFYGFNDMSYTQNFETIGSGFNLKLGMIYKPIQQIRFGVAFHTPTFFNLRDKYSYSMTSSYPPYHNDVDSPSGEFDYSLVTPYRFIGSVGGLLLDKIAYNVEYELVDYTVMRLRDGGNGYDFQGENKQISSVYSSSSNFRGGLEYRQGAVFLRGGYAYYGSPIKSGYLNDKSNIQVFAAGVGIRTGTFYTDFAFNKSVSSDEYYLVGNDLVKNKNQQNQFILTFGYKF